MIRLRMRRRDVTDGMVFYYVEPDGSPMLGAPTYRQGAARTGQPAAVEAIAADLVEEQITAGLDVVVIWNGAAS